MTSLCEFKLLVENLENVFFFLSYLYAISNLKCSNIMITFPFLGKLGHTTVRSLASYS